MSNRDNLKKSISIETMLKQNITDLNNQVYEGLVKQEKQKKEIDRLTELLQNSRAE